MSSASPDAASLARTWIETWNRSDPQSLPLADDFEHSSPLGVLKGREAYLAVVVPMAKVNVTELRIVSVISDGSDAAIRFEMETPNGVVQVCDWIHCDAGLITKVVSFYDASDLPLRESY